MVRTGICPLSADSRSQRSIDAEPVTAIATQAVERHSSVTTTLPFLDCSYYWRCEQSALRHRRLSDQIAPFRLALPNSAAIAFTPCKLAPCKSASENLAPLRSVSLRSAWLNLTPLRFAPTRLACYTVAPRRSASDKSTRLRLAPRRSALFRLAPRRSRLLKSDSLRLQTGQRVAESRR